jgi:hypothetical protein
MTPTLDGRLQTRLFLSITVGVLWTAVIVPFLPEPAGVSLGMSYDMAFGSLLVMTVYGLVWEHLYHALQQMRWDKDWPSVFALLSVLVEAPLVWVLDFLFPIMSMSGSGMQMSGPMGPMSSSPGLPSPYFPGFAIHVGTTWVLMWLFSQGLMRVICIRWRFEGGRVLSALLPEALPEDRHPQIPQLEGNGTAGARLPETASSLVGTEFPVHPVSKRAQPNGSAANGDLVQGITCSHGHFGHPGLRYCLICGVSLLPTTGRLGPGRRPPLGVLILEDGTRHVVNSDLRLAQAEESGSLTVGRRDEMPAATAMAEIRLAGWQIVVSSESYRIDVTLPGDGHLHVAPGSVLAALRPGAEFTIGKHRIRYESPYQPADLELPAHDPQSRPVPGNGAATSQAAAPPSPAVAKEVLSNSRIP